MLRLGAASLLTSVVILGSAAPAEASPLVDRADRHGDVTVTGSTDGVDPAIVDSVDLRHVTVTRQRHGVRVVLRLKQVLEPGRWFQQVGITSLAPGWAGGGSGQFFAAFATPQHLGSAMAVYVEDVASEDEEGEAEPIVCRVAATKGAKVVRLVIPDRCLPTVAGELQVSSGLVDKRGDNPLNAQDELSVSRPVDLQPRR